MVGFTEKMKIEAFKEVVRLCEEKFDESVFNECLEIVRQTELRNAANLNSTVRRFLYTWGRMGRVLGQKQFKAWERRLTAKIEAYAMELEDLRVKDFSLVNLNDFESAIKKYYESFSVIVGPIGAAKTLHLICPDFFPLWDNPIANAFRSEREGEKDKKFSAADYFKFMKDMQAFAIKYQVVLNGLATQYKKGKLRILDEFFWWMSQRPFSIFLT